MSLYNFLTKNKFKGLTIKAYIYSAVFRFEILTQKPDKLHKKWGEEGVETPFETLPPDQRKKAARISVSVNRICNKTKWESKCLVRALTAQKLLTEAGIPSTLYLGCGKENEKMIAHAWIRAGSAYITGGNGEGYAIVDMFSVSQFA